MKTFDTKKSLANSFKKLMKIKPVSKISITDIITESNVNRKTFYYHFDDICSLFKWIHQQDAIEYIKKLDLIEDYEEAITFIINYLKENKNQLCSAFDAFGSDGVKNIFHEDFVFISKKLIDSYEKKLDTHISQDYKDFVYIFYVEAVTGYIINLIRFNKSYEDEIVINYMSTIFKSSLPEVLKNGPKK